MSNYLSLILGAATCGAAFLWMMLRIRRAERYRAEKQKAAKAAAAGIVGVSSTTQYAEPRELAHTGR